MHLYFEDSRGNFRLVCKNCNKENVHECIINYVRSLNPNYKIYYVRFWGNEEHGYTYDVGSHTEFFHLIKERHAEA